MTSSRLPGLAAAARIARQPVAWASPVALAAAMAWPGPSAMAAPAGTTAAVAAAAQAAVAPRGDTATRRAAASALGDLGLALLRDTAGSNAVVSPLAVATVLGMVQAGAVGATEHEIESLFGPGRAGAAAMRQSLPALSAQLRGAGGSGAGAAGSAAAATTPAPLRQAARLWIDRAVAKDVPVAYQRRLAQRHGADAVTMSFAEPEAARSQINQWTAEHTGGRVTELLGAGSLGRSTQVTLTAAVHFRSPWQQPFDPAATEPRPFRAAGGTEAQVPTLNDERAVAQVVADGTQLYALPFAGGFDLVVALPAAGAEAGGTEALLKGLGGESLSRWHAALATATPVRCAFSMPKFAFSPKAGSIRPLLERLGVKTAFTTQAELRPMLGRAAAGVHVDDVHHAAGMSIDEQGGEAVAAAAASIKPKTLAAPAACAVDRAFVFAVMHRASGAPVFIGRVGDPARLE